MVHLCGRCNNQKAALRRPKTSEQVVLDLPACDCLRLASNGCYQGTTGRLLAHDSYNSQLCRDCFYEVFEEEVHQTIVGNKLFKSGEKVAIGASGMLLL